MVNLLKPSWDQHRDEGPFRWRRARVGRQPGCEKLGASLFELMPDSATFPFHAHLSNEEMLLILDGNPTLVTPAGERRLETGDVLAFRAGLDGAHRIENQSQDPVRLLVVSTMLAPEVNVMPEDDTFWVRDYAPGTDGGETRLDLTLRLSDPGTE